MSPARGSAGSSGRRPILVTGAPRSGSTWVGRMLALAPGVGYIHEPFNPVATPKGISSARFERYFEHVTADVGVEHHAPLARTLAFSYTFGAQLGCVRSGRDVARTARDAARLSVARARGLRPLVKDPIALFSAEWLADRFGMDVVVTIRHPAAVVASFKRLGWRHRFRSFLEQPALMRAYLEPYRAEIEAAAQGDGDVVLEAILLWRLTHHTIGIYRERHPEWLFRRHEDLAREPASGFAELYERLGLELTPAARRGIERHSAEENPLELESAHAVRMSSAASIGSWARQLTPAEIDAIRAGVADVSPAFYGDDEW